MSRRGAWWGGTPPYAGELGECGAGGWLKPALPGAAGRRVARCVQGDTLRLSFIWLQISRRRPSARTPVPRRECRALRAERGTGPGDPCPARGSSQGRPRAPVSGRSRTGGRAPFAAPPPLPQDAGVEDTPTCAGRSRRSWSMKPSVATWMMSPARVPGRGASNIAWCTAGSKRSPTWGAITVMP